MSAIELDECSSESKICPRCNCALALAEFGVSRARKDGRNIYCKRCNRERTNASRQSARQRRNRNGDNTHAMGAHTGLKESETTSAMGARNHSARSSGYLTPAERIKEVISKGPKTQKEILEETKLPKDDVGEALADLLLWKHEVGTKVVGETRLYFMRTSQNQMIESSEETALQSRFDAEARSSFSSLPFLLPGKDGRQAQKGNSWVAV